jgi:small GTP-binding protein
MVSVNTKVKIIVLGASGTGKSSLCRQYVQQVFEDAYEPTVEALFEKELYLCNKSVSVTLLDTAGQEDTNKTKEEYLAEGDGFVLVFSITDASTFHDIEGLYEDIITKKEGSSVPIVVIGNKCDLKHLRSITTEEAKKPGQQDGSINNLCGNKCKAVCQCRQGI